MNETITIDGIEYEVLTQDRISEITHAKLAGGKVTKVSTADDCHFIRLTPALEFFYSELEPFGIQPLKLLPKKPVEFVEVVRSGCRLGAVIEVPEGFIGKKFHCVEIVGEEA